MHYQFASSYTKVDKAMFAKVREEYTFESNRMAMNIIKYSLTVSQ